VDDKKALETERNLDDETINIIRKTRLESKKFVLNQSDTWLNNMVLICFGLGGALAPIAATISLTGRHQHKILLWLGVVLLIGNGIYLLMRIINKIADDQLNLQIAGLKEEYYLVRRRNVSDELLRGSASLKAYQKVALELFDQASQIAGSRAKHRNSKANYDIDITTGLLLSGLYFVAFAGISLRLRFIVAIYIVGLIIYVLVVRRQVSDATPILKERVDWENKIDEEEKRMTEATRDFLSNK
jgi:hypothetical protein